MTSLTSPSPITKDLRKRIAELKAEDFDSTSEAKDLSRNFNSFDAIVRALGINKASTQKYCQIVIGLANGRTVEFECTDLTVGARYKYGENWSRLSEQDCNNCKKHGKRLHDSLTKISPDLVIRTANGKAARLRVPLINLILRVNKLIELGYSPSEAVSLLDISPSFPSSNKRKGRSKHSKLKAAMTLFKQVEEEDPDLLEDYLRRDKGGVLIHGCLKGHPPDLYLYRKMGISSYKLRLLDDQSNQPVMNLDVDFAEALAVSEEKKQSLILSHTASNVIQLDDCDGSVVGTISTYCFEVVQTSPGSFHCRLALPIGTGQKNADSVRDRLLKTLNKVGSCNGGGGKTFRVPGSTNFKPGKDCKVTRILRQEKFTSIGELNLAGLIPYEYKSPSAMTATAKNIPVYSLVKTYKDHTDSARDFNFARQCASWGIGREQIVNELSKKSPTAAEKGESYIHRTVDRAIQNSKRWKSAPLESTNVRV